MRISDWSSDVCSSDLEQELVIDFADGRPRQGDRFDQVADEAETIGRGEYRWNAGGADWQVSGEGALNILDIENKLFTLNPAGDWVPVAFPNSVARSEGRRLGKECVRTCRSRWSPYH